jgi:hypothetical protein
VTTTECQPSGDDCAIIGVMTIKIGEQFSVSLFVPANPPISWAGIVGYSQIRDASDFLLYNFGTVAGTVDGSGNATINFVASGASTAIWPAGTYYVDFSFAVVPTFGPKTTETYKLIVCDGITVIP